MEIVLSFLGVIMLALLITGLIYQKKFNKKYSKVSNENFKVKSTFLDREYGNNKDITNNISIDDVEICKFSKSKFTTEVCGK